MPQEERRISPAIAIIPIGLGLAVVGVLAALAWAAPPVPPEGYVCPYCGAPFATQEELDAHIESEHPAPPETGMITLYMTGTPTQEWTVGWYYAETGTFLRNIEYYPPAGFETPWKRPSDPCTPPEPIDLNSLRVKIETYSEIHTCPLTGYKGSCRWGEFGPFVVEDGGIYTIDVTTGVLSKM